jgi:hypothetical protein
MANPFYPDDRTDRLAVRLAAKAGLTVDVAKRFLEAFEAIAEEDASTAVWPAQPDAWQSPAQEYSRPWYGTEPQSADPGPSPAVGISIPLIERADGTMFIDTAAASGWFPLKWPKWPSRPAKPPADPRTLPPGAPKPGGFPGPCVYVTIHDEQRPNLSLDKVDFGNLGDVLGKAKPASNPDEMLWLYNASYRKLEEE